jgi:hypothetical protein
MDGHPLYAIDPGQTLVYEFEVLNGRAWLFIIHIPMKRRQNRFIGLL